MTSAKTSKSTKTAVARTSVPSAFGSVARGSAAVLRTQPKLTTVRHREFVADVYGSGTGVVSQQVPTRITLPCNPGISKTFPWLCGVANQFELYRFVKLEFEYVTRSSTTTQGFVAMCFDLDALDQAPTKKSDLMSFAISVSGSPWQNFSMPVPAPCLTRFARERYTRKGETAVTDVKTYDVGNFHLIAEAPVTSQETPLGELYVSYDVELLEPQVRVLSAAAGSTKVTNTNLSTPWIAGLKNLTGQFADIFETIAGSPTLLRVKQAFEGLFEVNSLTESGAASTLSWALHPKSAYSKSYLGQYTSNYAAGMGTWALAALLQPGDVVEMFHTSTTGIGWLLATISSLPLAMLGINPTVSLSLSPATCMSEDFQVAAAPAPSDKKELSNPRVGAGRGRL